MWLWFLLRCFCVLTNLGVCCVGWILVGYHGQRYWCAKSVARKSYSPPTWLRGCCESMSRGNDVVLPSHWWICAYELVDWPVVWHARLKFSFLFSSLKGHFNEPKYKGCSCCWREVFPQSSCKELPLLYSIQHITSIYWFNLCYSRYTVDWRIVVVFLNWQRNWTR